jgi:hypothetical protein
MSAHPPAGSHSRNWRRKSAPGLVAAAATLVLVGIANPAAVHASKHATSGAAIAAHQHDLAGNPAHSDASTATTRTTPATAPGAATGHVILTGCVPGLNC